MIPPLIVRKALECNLDLIAITDHNATENAPAVMRAAEGTTLAVLPGIELQTKEEVHCLCLFDTVEQLKELQKLVDEKLPNIPNNIELFGEQFIVDHTGDFIKRKETLLLNSTRFSFEEAFQVVNDLNGLFIPAHVNRKAFGVIYNLGFIPTTIPLFALEISRHISPEQAMILFPELENFSLIQNGDVHYLDDFLGATSFFLEKPTIEEMKFALMHKHGRFFEVSS